ncbi:Hypothetical protein A7982_09321 [Minicystis rosea]|nr:Hypothetical protein A7982_09321 [Minicystis rosea]
MRNAKAWLLGAVVAVAAMANVPDADACGGCFAPPSETTVVTGHKMILSISQDRTTLYDQIVYSGDPSSFAWILPVKGVAEVGLSSDALFQNLGEMTSATIYSPQCGCGGGFFGGGGSGGEGGGSDVGTVTVVSQKTVGPYETVQLKSTDPSALDAWLADHGYAIPTDVQSVIDAYVAGGFDFLALKLVPGKDVKAMRPVRITTPGASPVLPLRMVAAGTGATTPITLWVMGEGRYTTVNLPSFTVDPSLLVWDWNTSESNYAQLKQSGFAATQNKGWLVEAAEPFSRYALEDVLQTLILDDPTSSGYDPANPDEELASDMDALFGSISSNALWITRLNAQLSRSALGADLQLGAAPKQTVVQRAFFPTLTVGPDPCGCSSIDDDPLGNSSGGNQSSGCAMTQGNGAPTLGGLALMAALAFARRRRR